MDFVSGLLRKKRQWYRWIIVDRLTKHVFFLLIKITNSVDKLVKIYVNDVIRLHGILMLIVSYRNLRFTSFLWPSIHHTLGTKLNLSIAFHPQIDGQSKRKMKTLEDLLRACVLGFEEIRRTICHFVEFTYNNSYQASVQMTP